MMMMMMMMMMMIDMLSFRTRQALGRFWEGTGLLHQMRGEWSPRRRRRCCRRDRAR